MRHSSLPVLILACAPLFAGAVACKAGDAKTVENSVNSALSATGLAPQAPATGAASASASAPTTAASEDDEPSMDVGDDAIVAKKFLRGPAAGGEGWKLDLAQLQPAGDEYVTALAAPSEGTAHLTVDATLQKTAEKLLAEYEIPEASIVLVRPRDGKILVYASRIATGRTKRDLNVEASAPSASLFKIITGTALVDHAGLGPETPQCWSGGMHRIQERDLQADPKRDTLCTTLAGAMGHSTNTVFARLASQKLTPTSLGETARAYRYGSALPFDVPVEPSALQIPEETLGFARTAAGFWNTTLSPLHAAWIASVVANGGEGVRPYVVASLESGGKTMYTAPESRPLGRIISARTAEQVTRMMENTVAEGTSRKAFHDPRGKSFFPQLPIAGKTGTLTDEKAGRFYTWFSGFAPSRPVANVEPVAIAVLAVNGANWKVKANTVAREVLRAYFAGQDVPGVTAPTAGKAKATKNVAAATTKKKH